VAQRYCWLITPIHTCTHTTFRLVLTANSNTVNNMRTAVQAVRPRLIQRQHERACEPRRYCIQSLINVLGGRLLCYPSPRSTICCYGAGIFGRYTDLLSADMGGAYYTQVYRLLHCDKNLRLGYVLYSMAYYIRSFTVVLSMREHLSLMYLPLRIKNRSVTWVTAYHTDSSEVHLRHFHLMCEMWPTDLAENWASQVLVLT